MYPPFLGPYGTYGNLGLYGGLVAYGSAHLTEASPPQSFVEPVSIDEMISYLRLPDATGGDPSITDELTGFIIAARARAETLQGLDLVVKQWDLAFDYWPSYRVELRAPLVSVDLVQYRDSDGDYTTLVADTDYVVDGSKQPPVLAPPYNKPWPTFTPWPSSALLVRFTSGVSADSAWWSDSGANVKRGIRLLAKGWFNKESLTDQQMAQIEVLLMDGGVPRAK